LFRNEKSRQCSPASDELKLQKKSTTRLQIRAALSRVKLQK
jgi:hypothetical protein